MIEKLISLAFRSHYIRSFFGFTPRQILGDEYFDILDEVNLQLVNSGDVVPLNVNDDDKVIIYWYSKDIPTNGLDYRDLNGFFRNPKHDRALELTALAVYLNEAIRKFPCRNIASYRVAAEYPNMPVYSRGYILRENSFLSCTRNPRPGFEGAFYFTLFGERGRDIAAVSNFEIEDEILFSPFTSFEILNVENLRDKTTHVTMKEIV